MRSLLSALFGVILFASFAWAGSLYLTCDPYPADSLITSFVVYKDGVVWVQDSQPKVLPDGSFVLWEDVSNLPSGDHTFTAEAVSGLDTSSQSVPFVWSRRIPSSPALKISIGD